MTGYTPLTQIKVGLDFTGNIIPVGRLAIRERKIYFEYDANFIKNGLELSPLRLPLKTGVQSFEPFLFEGLPGLFNDSLPDGWGKLLFDRSLRTKGIMPEEISPLDRLAHVGMTGMGALVYEPEIEEEADKSVIDLDRLAASAQDVLDGEAPEALQTLLSLNGSSGGARPKAIIGVDKERKNILHGKNKSHAGYEPWIVKFPNSSDGLDSGAIEYVYALMAKEAGLIMSDVHLFPAKRGSGYFATKRFDRDGNNRVHVHSVCGLLHSDFRTPSLDYEDLIALTSSLTRDMREIERMFRQAVFNILGHNRDDHSKNFSFTMDIAGAWALSPAYDLTFSSGPRGEQSTMVMGEGKNPTETHLIKLGLDAKIDPKKITQIIEQTKHALSQWKTLAKNYGVSHENITLIENRLSGQ